MEYETLSFSRKSMAERVASGLARNCRRKGIYGSEAFAGEGDDDRTVFYRGIPEHVVNDTLSYVGGHFLRRHLDFAPVRGKITV